MAERVIEPTLGLTPILDSVELRRELQEIDRVRQQYGDDCEKHLTARQRHVYWHDYEEREDLWEVGEIGDGWYNCATASVSATSAHRPAGNITYTAANAHDFSLGTAWVCEGTGESITFRINADEENEWEWEHGTVTTVFIYNGYQKSARTWRDNSRIKQFRLHINDKPYALLNLRDTTAVQCFDIGQHRAQRCALRFEITEVYRGNRWPNDVAVSEIEFDGDGCLCFGAGTMIAVPDGEKAIEQIVAGDVILAPDPASGCLAPATVLGTARRNHRLYRLGFDSGLSVEVTADHPLLFDGDYYSIAENALYGLQTRQLAVGQQLNVFRNGHMEALTLRSITPLDGLRASYTITALDRGGLFLANGLCAAVEAVEAVETAATTETTGR
jgi:hypothetical protein